MTPLPLTKGVRLSSPLPSGEGGRRPGEGNEVMAEQSITHLIEAYRGTVSLPFEPSEHGRVAVKIVDDRGVESLKVIQLTQTEIG